MNKHQVTPENAIKINVWLVTRGGIAIWESVNLSNPEASWTTPATNDDGTPATKPTWEAGDKPARIITDSNEVEVVFDREVKRFRVAVRCGSNGLSFKVTDRGSDRIRREVARAGKGATYRFDYDTQEAVILAPDKIVPLADFVSDREKGLEP